MERQILSQSSLCPVLHKAKPFLAVTLLQFGYAGQSIIVKIALNQGMSHYTLAVYRHAIATALILPFAIVLERPVIDQNLYYSGMRYTSATFATSMCNMIPALTFLLAFLFRMEKVNIRRAHSLVKVVGTIVTLMGAMLMTLIKGPVIHLPWTEGRSQDGTEASAYHQHPLKGSLMITAGCFCSSGFVILLAITLKTYPAELSLTAWICMMGTIEGTLVTLAMERGNTAIWSLNWNMKFVAALYSGILCSGIAYYVQGMIMKERGPVFITAFSPLDMIIVAILSSFILAEQLWVGSVIGAIVIVTGLYLVLWGKSKDDCPTPASQVELPTAISSKGEKNHDHELVTIVLGKTGVATPQEPSSTGNNYVKEHIPNAPSLAAALLRMHFHDCFVEGCDASVLLNSTLNNQAEKSGIPNLTLRGFTFIDGVKSLLEKECPGVVSCADIVALVARDAVSTIGGPTWEVPTGRRDGLISNATETLTNIPAPTNNFTTLVSKFANKGLDVKDLVLLSGAHTIGISHCNQSFAARLYNFTGHGDEDPSLDKEYAVDLKGKCKTPLDNTTIFEMDPGSFRTFDLSYYKLLLKRRGLFVSDAALITNSFSKSEIIQLAQGSLYNFYEEFGKSMVKMGMVGVKTGSSGEIRKNCAVLNS
ncbi:hypothetical protein NE237_001889 [Protea cynaroides]|uniref:Plant heme peroxidase family profile domain-containing protein n=1 Tax=Protea cynaroides TaxID=273540 RepID=A0A9Q0QYJ3_9MAGN|nr:hypothetical protein NE237_001889 [Protea cynaroides]